MRRLLRGTFKLSIIAGAVAALVVVGRKLMGGLGPEPGSDAAPKEWPSMVPEPAATPGGNGTSTTSGNGAGGKAAATKSEGKTNAKATAGGANDKADANTSTGDAETEGGGKIDWTAPSSD